MLEREQQLGERSEKNVREKKNADTKVNEEGEGGAPGAKAEVPLQPMVYPYWSR